MDVRTTGWSFGAHPATFDLLPCGTAGDYHTTSVDNNPLPHREDCLRLAEKVGLDTNQALRIYKEIERKCNNK